MLPRDRGRVSLLDLVRRKLSVYPVSNLISLIEVASLEGGIERWSLCAHPQCL